MNRTDTVHKQLQRLMQGGLTPDEACSALRNLGFTAREVGTLTTTGVFRKTDVQLPQGRPHAAHEVKAGEACNCGESITPTQHGYFCPARPANKMARSNSLLRGWEKPRSRRWDKVISAGSLLAIECGAAALMVLGTAHVASSFQSKTAEIWTAISGTVVTAVALVRMRRGR